MNKKYFSILETLKENKATDSGPNDRILLIDGLNTFIRAFAANPVTNDDGIHVGGITGFLMSIGYAIRNIKPTRVVICWDGKGGSQRRRKLYPEYKGNRRVSSRLTRHVSIGTKEDEKVAMKNQLLRLSQYIDTLPLQMVSVENIEADDSIAYICEQVYPKSQVFIMSTDKDFMQLVSNRVTVWSPTKNKYYFADTIKEEYGIHPNNFLMFRTITGDGSDNIPGIRGAGLKTLINRIPIISNKENITINQIIEYCKENSNIKILKKISEASDLLNLNYDLMQLNDVDISGSAKLKINNCVKNKIPRLVKYEFLKMMIEDNINSAIKNPEFWLRDTFLSLDTYAGMTHER